MAIGIELGAGEGRHRPVVAARQREEVDLTVIAGERDLSSARGGSREFIRPRRNGGRGGCIPAGRACDEGDRNEEPSKRHATHVPEYTSEGSGVPW